MRTANPTLSGTFPATWALALWTLAYFLLGHLGIKYAAFPDSWLTMIWMPSGIGVMMALLYGGRALPWIFAGSLLVNGPYILMDADRVGWLLVLTSVGLFGCFDTIQCVISWKILAKYPLTETTWNANRFLRFLAAVLLGPLLTCWALILCFYGFGFAPYEAGVPFIELFLRHYAMLTLGDAQGIFLIVPALCALQLVLRDEQTRRKFPWPSLSLVLLLPIPLLLGQLQPFLVSLMFPLVTLLIIRTRFLGAALSVAVLGLSIAFLTAAGLNPIPLGSGIGAFAKWSLLLLSMGTPLLLLGMLLDDNLAHQTQLESRVSDRTHKLTEAHRLAEAATERALESSRVKSEFLANMSHEIRTPLNSVIGFTELLERNTEDSRQLSYLKAVKAGGQALLTLINDILDLSKIEADKLEIRYTPVSLRPLFEDTLQIFSQKAAEKSVTLQLDIQDDLPACLMLDEVRLRQVLFNLIGNALKFTECGHVSVRITGQPLAHNTGQLDLELSISDTGIGIPTDALESIFEVFRQQPGQEAKKYGGTGLGLAITKKLVTMMNGQITVSSTLGQGSVFSVRFTGIEVAVGAPALSDAAIRQVSFEPGLLLIADDLAVNRLLLVELLKDQPFKILEAENGLQALELARLYQPDAILMDVRMPVMDGFTAVRKIRQEPSIRGIQVLALTASVMQHEINRLLEAGFDACVKKPLSQQTLYACLMQHLPYLPQSPSTPSLQPASATQHQAISPEQLSGLPELIIQLEDKPLELSRLLLSNKKMSLLDKFADEMRNLSEAYPVPLLKDYALSISRSLDNLDVEQLDGQLKHYPSLVAELKALMISERD